MSALETQAQSVLCVWMAQYTISWGCLYTELGVAMPTDVW